jgi:hypothetical protein
MSDEILIPTARTFPLWQEPRDAEDNSDRFCHTGPAGPKSAGTRCGRMLP